MKRIVTLLLIFSTLFVFAACAGAQNANNNVENPATETEKEHIHDFGDWVIVKKATCIEEGTRERTCSCGEKQTESIALTDHDWEEATCGAPRTCKICHKTEGTPTGVHTTKQGYCAVCGTFVNELSDVMPSVFECTNNIAYASMRAVQYINLKGDLNSAITEFKKYPENINKMNEILSRYPGEFTEMRRIADELTDSFNECANQFNNSSTKTAKEKCILAMHKVFTNWQLNDLDAVKKLYIAPSN